MAVLASVFVIEKFAQDLVAGIRENIRTKNVTGHGPMHTTGAAEDSLFYRIEDNALIIGSKWKYIRVLEDGRRPGKFVPLAPIEKWLSDKNIASNIPRKSLAFLISRKIKNEGTALYKQGGNSGILSEYINLQYIHKNLTEPLGKAYIDEVTGILFKTSV